VSRGERWRLEAPALGLALEPGEADELRTAEDVAALVGPARRGPVWIDGRRIDRSSLAGRVKRGLAVISSAEVAADVSLRDHLAAIVGAAAADDLLADAPRLAGRGGLPAGVLSGGERRILAWLRAIALDPAVVVLDRAGTGLDDETLHWTAGVVAAWRSEGACILARIGRPEEQRWLTSDVL
jgi:branched-chain amino acid transport system ATP-binding protein